MIKYLETLNRIARSLNIDISHLTTIYSDEVRRLTINHGKNFAVVRLKEYLTICERYALHQSVDPLPFTKSDSEGFPSKLSVFKPYLRGKNFKPILGLSILRFVESLRVDISKDISTVTKSCFHTADSPEDLTIFIEEWGRNQKITSLPSMNYHTTYKNGPNGPALKTADRDLGAVINDPKLWKALLSISSICKDKLPPDDTLKTRSDYLCSSRISQFPEKSGKTRTIAVIDYWSQRALKPLHKSLMKTLRRLKSDGTYSHDNVGEYAKQKTLDKSYIFCADLSAATDRLPRYLSFHLLKGLLTNYESELCESYWTILTDRTFKLTWSSELVVYGCGQPMGAYASWPLFALTHHSIVQYCGRHLNDVNRYYRLIGDDVIITNEKMAQNYQEIMTSLGMTINQGKSVTSAARTKYSSAEVAKQLFLQGRTLTPFTPGIISSLSNPMLFNTTLRVLMSRYTLPEHFPVTLMSALYRNAKSYDKVWLLSSNQMNGSITRVHPFWKDYDLAAVTEMYWFVRFKSFMKTATSIKKENDKYHSQSLEKQGHCDQGESPQNPYNDAQLRASDQLIADYEFALQEMDMQVRIGSPDLLELEYIVNPLNPFMDIKELRAYKQSSLMLETIAGLTDRIDTFQSQIDMRSEPLFKEGWERLHFGLK